MSKKIVRDLTIEHKGETIPVHIALVLTGEEIKQTIVPVIAQWLKEQVRMQGAVRSCNPFFIEVPGSENAV